MQERTKKKILAIEIAVLVVLSSVAIYAALDRLEIFPSPSEPVIEQDEFPEEDEVLDPTAEKVKELIQEQSPKMMQDYIKKLTQYGPHPTALRIPYKLSNRPIIGKFFDLPIEKVAKYIYKEFKSMGLEVRYQYWEREPTKENLVKIGKRIGWPVGDNIEATLPGTDKSSDEIYVVIAHYDTVPEAPGANDDSSGVAAVLSAAKLMSKRSFNHTIRFVTVSGHEQYLLGSHAYVEEAVKNNDNIVATLCVDMIGTSGPDYRDTEVLLTTGNERSYWIRDFATDVNQRYSEYLNFTVLYDEHEGTDSDVSDYLEFVNDGYDALYFCEATDDRDRHKPTDTIKNMDVLYAAKVSKLVIATLAEMAWDVESE